MARSRRDLSGILVRSRRDLGGIFARSWRDLGGILTRSCCDFCGTGGFKGGQGGRGFPPPFCFFLDRSFVVNRLRSRGIVQSPQGCSCVASLERSWALAKNFSAPSGSAPGWNHGVIILRSWRDLGGIGYSLGYNLWENRKRL